MCRRTADRRIRIVVLPVAVAILSACGGLLSKPPVSVSFRDSFVEQGKVFRVTNTSDRYLHALRVFIRTPEGEERSVYFDTLAPHETLEAGWLELNGWVPPEGCRVSVSCEGFSRRSGPWYEE